MKFIHDADGKLVPAEGWQLESEIAKLEDALDTMGASDRVALVERLRSEWNQLGSELTQEDNEVLVLFCDGTLDYRHLVDHFGPRLTGIARPKRT